LVLVSLPLSLASWTWGWLGGVAGAVASGVLLIPYLVESRSELDGAIGALLLGVVSATLGLRHLWQRRPQRKLVNHRVEVCYGEDMFENSLNIGHVIDREGNVIRRNRTSREILGWAYKRTLHLSEYVHPEDLGKFKAQLEQLFERGEIRGVELRFTTEGRGVVPVELQAKRVTGRVAVMEAQDHRRVAELKRRLAEEEARYRYLIEDGIDTLDLGIVLVDKQGHVLWANRAVEKFFGVPREALVGIPGLRAIQQLAQVLEDPQDFLRRVQAAYQSGSPVEEVELRVWGGRGRRERILQYRSIPIQTQRYKGGRVDYFADITQLKRLQEELRQRAQELQEVNEKLSQFTSVVSHDLRSPANLAMVHLSKILHAYDGALPPPVRERLEKLKGLMEYMDKLVDTLAHYSEIRLTPDRLERVDMNREIRDRIEDLGEYLQGVSVKLADDFPVVYGIPTLLGEVITNLVRNAVKFNDKALPQVEIGWKEGKNGTYIFYVKDNGPGIERQYWDTIFVMFEKLDRNKEGTGAGLAICRRIVEEHGGKIWLESKLGEGTTFYFSLPKAPVKKGVEHHAQ
jgi:PAS domain S-box-containing protein